MSWSRTETDAQTGTVIVINQSAYTNGSQFIILDDGVNPPEGYTHTESLPESPPQVPYIVTMRQARLALHAAGLLQSVEAAIDAMVEPDKTAARIEWGYASEVHRASEFVGMLGAALELDEQTLDSLFLKAVEL